MAIMKTWPPLFKFCPLCGSELVITVMGEDEYQACPDTEGCKWVYWGHTPTTVAAVILEKGKILLVRRARNPGKDLWCLPAGFCEYGEMPADAVRREVKEEVGIEIELLRDLPVHQALEDSYPRTFSILNIFTAKGFTGEPTAGDDATEIGWFDVNELPIMAFSTHQDFLKGI